jgi:hypothetical protein
MDPTLVAKLSEDARSRDLEDHFPQSAKLAWTRFQRFNAQTVRFCKALIHPVQIGRKERGLIASGSGANFHDRIAVFVWIGRKQRELHMTFQLGNSRLQIRDLRLREFRKLIVSLCEFLIIRQITPAFAQ